MFKYKKTIIVPLIVAAVLLCVSMAGLFIAMYELVYFSEQKDQVDHQRYDIVALSNAMTKAESGQRGYLLTGHTLFLNSMEQGQAQAHTLIKQFAKDAADAPSLRPGIQELNTLVQLKFDDMKQRVQVQLQAGSYASHLSLSKDKGILLMKQINEVLNRMDEMLKQTRVQYEQEIRERMVVASIGAVLLLLLIVGVLWFSYRSTTRLLEQVIETQDVAQQMSHEAEHDLLTGLPNRRSIDVHLAQMYEVAKHSSKPFAVYFMDLDGFKQVNDQYGHEVGDALLIEVATRFQTVIRQSDFIARQGGDEFVLALGNYLHRLELVQLAERLLRVFAEPLLIKNIPLKVGVSIGISEFPHHGSTVSQLLQAADKAMYQAKKNGKNQYRFFSERKIEKAA